MVHRGCGVVAASKEAVSLIAVTDTSYRNAILLTIAAGVVRLVLAAVTPLFPDETYYWEWSRHLAAGYFDHPPVLAWLIRAGTAVAGNTPPGVRLGSVVAGTLAGLLIAASARRLSGDRAALSAAMVFAVMPLSAAGLVLATPDAPLLAASAAALYAVVRTLGEPTRSSGALKWWCVAGLALGVAMSSKYTAVLLPLSVFVALLARRDLRERLREPGPYVATLVAVLVFLPVMLWNARHEWASFAFQLQHGLGSTSGSVIRRELDLLGGQLGLVSPILFVMMVVAVVGALSDRVSPAPRRALLAFTAMMVFAFFMYSATNRRVEANWPALSYIPATLLVASHAGGRAWNRWLRAGLTLAAALTLVAYVNSVVPILPVPARRDPVARAAGWDHLAAEVNRTYAVRRTLSSYRTWVAAERYQEASELAFHLPDNPETFALNLTARPNNYDLWPRFTDRAQPRDGLILVVDDVEGTHPAAEMLAPHFTNMQRAEQVVLARDGDPVKYLRIWLLNGWRGTWPQPQLRSRP